MIEMGMSIEHERFPAPWTEEGTLSVRADHFADASIMISVSKGAEKEIADLMLTRISDHKAQQVMQFRTKVPQKSTKIR